VLWWVSDTCKLNETALQCCFAAYDRTLDGIVKLFVPFYDELKSLVILFFILTRSRVRTSSGAPIPHALIVHN
jgi:hypothetical protein